MRRDHESVQSDLNRIAALLKEENIAAAVDYLTRMDAHSLAGEFGLDFQILKTKAHLVERDFGVVRAELSELRKHALDQPRLQELVILDAYAHALAGDGRQAIRLVVPVLRKCEPFEEVWARAAYVAGLAMFRRGHYSWAQSLMGRVVAYYRLADDRIELSRALNSLALVEKSFGRLDRALECFDDAVGLIPADKYPRHRRRLLTNRGVCLLKLGKIIDARICLLEAVGLAYESKDLFVDVAINNNLGHAHRIAGEYEPALASYTKALQCARESSSRRQECLSLEFLGELYIEMENYGEAADYLQRAYAIASELAPHGDLMMEILRRRGELFAALGRKEEAEGELRRAIQLCGSRGEIRERVLAERALLLLHGDSPSTVRAGLAPILEELKRLGDRFEFVRTVYLGWLKTGRRSAEEILGQEALLTARYYADSLELSFWKQRLDQVVGYSRKVPREGRDAAARSKEVLVDRRSRAFGECLEAVRLAARSTSPVLIVGETGAGKEVVARLIHEEGPRAAGPLIAINCGALPEALVESELFGHARGTFTGAIRDKEGLFESASGGSVFLDEVGELTLPAQVKLLRFLDSGEFRRVGETRIRRSDTRVLAASNRDLLKLVEEGSFRKDLFFRLNVFQIQVPPLRDRKAEILPLVAFFLRQACRPGMVPELSPEVKNALEDYRWPGNIRELKNACEYLAAKSWGKSMIVLDDLRIKLPMASDDSIPTDLSKFEHERVELERQQICKALESANGKILHAAKLLGIGRNKLAQRMRELGIFRESFRI